MVKKKKKEKMITQNVSNGGMACEEAGENGAWTQGWRPDSRMCET
jgi:hypothetical protein